MEKKDVLKSISDIFVDVFESPEIVVSETTSVNDVEGWDSLAHIQLVVSIEKQFKIRFTSTEIQSWKNVGEMIDCLCGKIS